jgi:hypothetical protein
LKIEQIGKWSHALLADLVLCGEREQPTIEAFLLELPVLELL